MAPISVNIVPSEEAGWIIGRIVHELASRNDWSVGGFRTDCDVNYFINYHAAANVRLEPGCPVSAAWFTHPEDARFFNIAKRVDVRVCHAEKYARVIDGFAIAPGIDEVFAPRLRLGVVGRTYASGRKGEFLLNAVRKLDFVDLVSPPPLANGEDERLWLRQLSRFYASIDALLVTSLVEGGPVPAAEATACGIPVIAPSSVGNLEKLGVIDYEVGSEAALLCAIRKCFGPKIERASTVADWTWARFAEENLNLLRNEFERLSEVRSIE